MNRTATPRPAGRFARLSAAVLAALAVVPSGLSGAEPVAVTAVRPSRGAVTRYATLPGTLRANQQVTVQARVAGFVKSIGVDRGDRVTAGQTLAEIEVPELIAERTRLLAEVRVAEAEAQRLTTARQRSPDLVTPQSVDAATGRRDVARAELEKVETLLRYANLTAPFAGVITARMVDPGAFVPAGAAGSGASAVVTLADTSVLRAQVPVPEAEAVLVRPGQPVRVVVDGLAGDPVRAVVSRHSGALDETTRTLVVEADLPNADGRLRPGMYASVRIGLEEHASALLVPTDAVALEKAQAFVFRVDGGRCRKTPVKLGFQDGPQSEVASGLAEDALVIRPARTAPTDGTEVRVGEAK